MKTEREFLQKLQGALSFGQYQDQAKDAMVDMMNGDEVGGLRKALEIAERVIFEIEAIVREREGELNG